MQFHVISSDPVAATREQRNEIVLMCWEKKKLFTKTEEENGLTDAQLIIQLPTNPQAAAGSGQLPTALWPSTWRHVVCNNPLPNSGICPGSVLFPAAVP